MTKAPCLTCDGTLIAHRVYSLTGWCRCRRRWSKVAIIRGMRRGRWV